MVKIGITPKLTLSDTEPLIIGVVGTKSELDKFMGW
jgi:hypothetical protein